MFAFLLESVGGGEWLVLLAVVLIVVGPKNLPSAARKMGKVMSQLRRAADEFKRQLMSMDDEMRKVGEDLKKEYVDLPASTDPATNAAAAGDEAAPVEDYGDPYPGNMPEDYYGDSGDEDRALAESAAAAGSEAPEAPPVAEVSAPVAEPASAPSPLRHRAGFESVSRNAAAEAAPAAPKITVSVSRGATSGGGRS